MNYLYEEINNGNIINDKLNILLQDINIIISDNKNNNDNLFWKNIINNFNNNCEKII